MASGYNTGAIQRKNQQGNLIALGEVNADTFALKTLTDQTNAIHLGHLSTSNAAQTPSKTDIPNEKGLNVVSTFDITKNTTGTLMQTDKAQIDFLAVKVKDKTMLEYKYLGVNNGKHQELFKVVNVTPQYAIDTANPGTSMPYESTAVYPDAAVTYNSTHLAAFETATGAVIYTTGAVIPLTGGTSDGYVLKETAVA